MQEEKNTPYKSVAQNSKQGGQTSVKKSAFKDKENLTAMDLKAKYNSDSVYDTYNVSNLPLVFQGNPQTQCNMRVDPIYQFKDQNSFLHIQKRDIIDKVD